ncbi:MAG: N-acetylglucosamine-6-phosphate deacetylase [Candidatus Sumerlaeia bacterium]|nr:N-acetylglucosamine-6-phosphate deacetylase [Candidatus Sumerlaeia bacterium]
MDLGIRAGMAVTPLRGREDVFIGVRGGKIRCVEPFHTSHRSAAQHFLDCCNAIVAPGFIDLQVNGGLGHNVMHGNAAQREAIYRFFLRRGTTTLLPTVVTASVEDLAAALARLADDVGEHPDLPAIPGIHLEGPFLNPERRGAHPAAYLRQPSLRLARQLFAAAKQRIRIVTLAPELKGTGRLIRWLASKGVVVSAGHTTASCETLLRACEAGLSLLTHLGNVSDWPYRRKNKDGILAVEPAAVGTFMISEQLRATVILDGYHFDARLAAALARLRGPQNLAIISDASYAAGCPPGRYDDGLIRTTVHPKGFAYATGGGGYLAGSVIAMEDAVRVAVQKGGIALRDAVEMATLTPARILGLERRKGKIAVGYDADLVVMNPDLKVRQVVRAGRVVNAADGGA